MKPLIFILVFILGQSCSKSQEGSLTENSQIQEQSTDQSQDVNDANTDQELLGPNEIVFKIKVLSAVQDNKEICGVAKDHLYKIEVLEIMESGGSLQQKVSENQQISVAFLFEPGQLQANSTLEAKARESLCQDTSTTYFTVIAHKILE
ncbi:hypothetical protein [Flagellimonas algicola]|uniref:Lipoprotein n=1 Tax=Flagellimonas algicola TaxID=2583815 RepID=A0ABY2WLG9_9FLAO|nr:hypothetical protein [Allomuricauda algicola]TMU55264.1 hypothetical protein FGG15_13880 [Allomuricauda algicola]